MGKSNLVTRFLAAALAVALLAACGPVPQLTAEQKLADFDFLFETFRDNHPFLFLKARTEQYDWVAHEEEFREAVRQTKDNAEFAKAVQRIVSLVGNAHTTVVGGWFVSAVKDISGPWPEAAAQTTAEIADYWMGLGNPRGTEVLYIIHSGGEYYVCRTTIQGLAAGPRLVAVDGVPVHDYIPTLRGTTYLRWDPLRRRLFAPQLMLFSGQQETVVVEHPSGEIETFRVQGEKLQGWGYLLTPHAEVVFTKTLAEGQVGYVHVKSMTTGAAHKTALYKYFSQVRDLPALIIDVRGNGGGASRFWMEYIVGQLVAEPVSASFGMAYRSAELGQSYARAHWGDERAWISSEELASQDPHVRANLPPELFTSEFSGILQVEIKVEPEPDSVRYQGKVFLLVDSGVYSAAESFAAFAKASGWATLVGSCTGGDGIGSTPALVVLPNSRMAVSFSTTLGLNPDWTANEETHTIPHVLVEESYEDLLKCFYRIRMGVHKEPDPEIDTALRECLRLAVEGR